MYLSGQAGLGRILIHKSYAFRIISSSHYYEKWIAIRTSHGSGSLINTFSSFLWSLPMHPASAKGKYIIFHTHVNRALSDTSSESREELFKPRPIPPPPTLHPSLTVCEEGTGYGIVHGMAWKSQGEKEADGTILSVTCDLFPSCSFRIIRNFKMKEMSTNAG